MVHDQWNLQFGVPAEEGTPMQNSSIVIQHSCENSRLCNNSIVRKHSCENSRGCENNRLWNSSIVRIHKISTDVRKS